MIERGSRAAQLTTDIALILVALTDGLLWIHYAADPMRITFAVVASLGLVLRRRLPLTAVVLALPQLIFSATLVAAAIALYTLARMSSKTLMIVFGTALVFASCLWTITDSESLADIIVFSINSALVAIGPAALGRSRRARCELSAKVEQLAQARKDECAAVAAQTLTQERARLAREMHDVVSHQVSLIAVQTGALQVSTTDPRVQETASRIRSLAVQTLDELRQMVGVLRAAGGEAKGIDPQPTVAELSKLIEDSDIDVSTDIRLPDAAAPVAVQRAIYRTIQEGLTNVRRHAPGSGVSVRVVTTGSKVTVSVENTASTGIRMNLPSARHGLLGLSERAELLGGRIDAGPTPDNGYRLVMELPLR